MKLTAAQSRALDAFLQWQGRTVVSQTLDKARKGRGVVVTLELDGPLMDGNIKRALGTSACWWGCSWPASKTDDREVCNVGLTPTLSLRILR